MITCAIVGATGLVGSTFLKVLEEKKLPIDEYYLFASKNSKGKKIDFIATKGNGERVYIQVAYEITEKNREREFGNFSSIKDNYPKYVVSRDHIQLSENGIIHMNIVDFLLHPLEK